MRSTAAPKAQAGKPSVPGERVLRLPRQLEGLLDAGVLQGVLARVPCVEDRHGLDRPLGVRDHEVSGLLRLHERRRSLRGHVDLAAAAIQGQARLDADLAPVERDELFGARPEEDPVAHADAEHGTGGIPIDTGLVLVYYLQRDLVRAEQLLLACLEMGAEQVPAARARLEQEDLSEEERADLKQELYDLEEAWGDAYQNLGVLELIHRKNPEKALAYFERSVEIGPMDDTGVTIRTDVTNTLIPMARGEDVPENQFSLLPRWGKPCDG